MHMKKYQYIGLVRPQGPRYKHVPRVSSNTVYRWTAKHAMPAHSMGCLWKFKKDEVEARVKAGGAAESNNKDSDR